MAGFRSFRLGNSVALTGKVTCESVPNDEWASVYSETSVKPVRGAMLEVLDATFLRSSP